MTEEQLMFDRAVFAIACMSAGDIHDLFNNARLPELQMPDEVRDYFYKADDTLGARIQLEVNKIRPHLGELHPDIVGSIMHLHKQNLGPVGNSLDDVLDWVINAPLLDIWTYMGELGQPVGPRTSAIANMVQNIRDTFFDEVRKGEKPNGSSLREYLVCLCPDQEEVFWELLEIANVRFDIVNARKEWKRQRLNESVNIIAALPETTYSGVLAHLSDMHAQKTATTEPNLDAETATLVDYLLSLPDDVFFLTKQLWEAKQAEIIPTETIEAEAAASLQPESQIQQTA